MIDTLGPYILIIISWSSHGQSMTSQEMVSREACKAAQIQLEAIVKMQTYCIAATVVKSEDGE